MGNARRRSRCRSAGNGIDGLELLGRLTPQSLSLGLGEADRSGWVSDRRRIRGLYRKLWLGCWFTLPGEPVGRPDQDDECCQNQNAACGDVNPPPTPGTYGYRGYGRDGPIPGSRHRAGSLRQMGRREEAVRKAVFVAWVRPSEVRSAQPTSRVSFAAVGRTHPIGDENAPVKRPLRRDTDTVRRGVE